MSNSPSEFDRPVSPADCSSVQLADSGPAKEPAAAAAATTAPPFPGTIPPWKQHLPPLDPQLERIGDRFFEARARNEILTAEQLCHDCPDRLEEVRQLVAAWSGFGVEPRLDQPLNLSTVVPAGSPVRTQVLRVDSCYESLQYLDEGGLGIVYVAQDSLLHRDVVIKFIQSSRARDEETRLQFRIEREVTGRLDHPGVVPVHGIGEDANGCLFYVMRRIQGQDFSEAIAHHHDRTRPDRRKDFELHRLITHVVATCKTIGYAHSRGILHRDIKPKNIKLGKYGETLVLDWGLALPVGPHRRSGQDSDGTIRLQELKNRAGSSSTNSAAGTPAYMSPEQAAAFNALPGAADVYATLKGQRGGRVPLDCLPASPASDVYSLGATLYEVLTGVPPFEGKCRSFEDLQATLRKIAGGQFKSPAAMRAGISPALNAICMKAMALRPEDRYASALDLADDLEHWLADEPVSAHRERAIARAGRWLRRHRAAALVGVAAGLMGLALFGALAVVQSRLKDDAIVARRKAEQERDRGLVVASEFAARNLSNEIESMLRMLEIEATDAELRSALEDLAKVPDDDAQQRANQMVRLQSWIFHLEDRRGGRGDDRIKARSWFLTNETGHQVARNPPDPERRGRSFASRDYFHGLGHELDEEELKKAPGPIRRPHVSQIFQSKFDKELVVCLSVPVLSGPWHNAGSRTLGVLALSIPVNGFKSLESKNSDKIPILIDMRSDNLSPGDSHRGMVLHHGLRNPNEGKRLEGAGSLARLRPEQQTQLSGLFGLEPDSTGKKLSLGDWQPEFIEAFSDPILGASRKAAACPTFLRSANLDSRPLEKCWLVVIERNDTGDQDRRSANSDGKSTGGYDD
ncbi:MAG: protein kinase [Planctomycetaceae bacterium]|nr:protein kinase [Planctomycetaceae bacterium]